MAVRKIGHKWRADIRWQRKRRYRIVSPINTKAGAQAFEAELRQKLAHGGQLGAQRNSDATFEAFSAEWFETYVKTNNKPSEVRQKRIILDRHLLPQFGSMLLSQITTRDVEEFNVGFACADAAAQGETSGHATGWA